MADGAERVFFIQWELGGIALINLEALRDFSKIRKYESGTVFSKDGTGTEMYIVLQGEVAIIDSLSNKIIDTVKPGNYFNASSVFSDKKSRITSRAITDVIALPISRIDIEAFIASEPRLVFELIKAMYGRFEKISCDYEAAAGCKWIERKPILADADTDIEPKSNQVNDNSQVANSQGDETSAVMPGTDFKLFPAGHTGEYQLPLTNDNASICEVDYRCPLCGNKFKGLKIMSSKLGQPVIESDMRKRYKDFEPVYYEVVTCPHCLYSALENIFEKPEDIETSLAGELKKLKNSTNIQFKTKPDTASVFAGYYLALLCASSYYSKTQIIRARLLHMLSWLYQDCKDEQMEMDLTKQALEKYTKAYLESDLSAAGEIQLVMTIGELNAKLGDIKEARDYYYKARMNNQISAVLKKRVENRLEELKEIDNGNAKTAVDEAKNVNVKGRRFLH
ncbi:MAG: DUF2225 domain-containing protein [Oscillospiraceae bacterium]